MGKKDKPFDFGGLRALLQGKPSRARWDALCARVFPMRWEADAPLWLPYAQSHLDRAWPDALRLWPEAWMSNPRSSAHQLVRALHVEHPSRRKLAQLTHALGLHAPPITHLNAQLKHAERSAEQALHLVQHVGPHLTSLTLYAALSQEAQWRPLVVTPQVARLTALALEHCNIHPNGLDAMLERAEGLRSLTLRGRWSSTRYSRMVSTLGELGHDARLESLVWDDIEVGRCVDELIARDWPNLTHLALTSNMREASEARRLLASASMPALKALTLSFYGDSSALGAAFVAAPSALRLDALHLSGTIHDLVRAHILTSPALEAITTLSLGPELGPRGMATLAALHGDRLTSLSLRGHDGDQRHVTSLWAQASWERLERLELWMPRVDEGFIEALASARFPALRELTLHELPGMFDEPAPLTLATAQRLKEAPWYRRLEHLDVAFKRRGGAALAAGLRASALG